MQVFKECYDSAGDIIKLAWEIDDIEVFPLAVIAMLDIFDADSCYDEYCEYEFEQPDEWGAVILCDIEDENWEGPVFFIKPYEI